MLVSSSFVNGGVVGFVGIQPLSCTKRKNARNPSSFLRAAIFFWAIYTNDKAHLTEQLSRDVFHQSALELSRELRPRENHLQPFFRTEPSASRHNLRVHRPPSPQIRRLPSIQTLLKMWKPLLRAIASLSARPNGTDPRL